MPPKLSITISATDDPTIHADWLELTALRSADRNSALQDLVAEIRRNGTADATKPSADSPQAIDQRGERTEAIGIDALTQVEGRYGACGKGRRRYPFKIKEQVIQLPVTYKKEKSLYLFLLALSHLGPRTFAGSPKPERLFEDISTLVAANYMGGASRYFFGFPRRVAPPGFRAALDKLCARLGEGQGTRDVPGVADQKDATLDLVVWLPFADGRGSQLIGYGQCAAGKNWKDKLGELDPSAFGETWMRSTPLSRPFKMFFTPHRVGDGEFEIRARRAGIFFDRCRIVEWAPILPRALAVDCAKWTSSALKLIKAA